MEVLYKQTISLGQETDTRTRFISAPVQGAASHDHCEENGRGSERKFLRFGSLTDLLGHLARQGYAAEKAVDLVCAEDALSVMDMIQHHLDEERSHDDIYLRKTCIRCLLYLNKRHGTLPTSIHLSKVTKDGHHPVSGGGFADIYKGRLEDTQQTVCLKVLRVYTATYDEKRLLKQLSNEVLIWRQLKYPNILQFLGITKEIFQPSYCIVSPWMANGTAISYSQTRKTTLNDKVKMMYEISEGIRYLHEHQPPIVHSDIKGLNILVSDDGKCCLADFGLAAIENDLPEGQVHLSTSQAVIRGSVPWLAPELMIPDHIGVPNRTARDIYALG
ncbi:kinase-like protein [Marasmius fiardii PR-910]|nr:kinase-like protein [Marasmius fiardii PR-910]